MATFTNMDVTLTNEQNKVRNTLANENDEYYLLARNSG